MFAFQGNAILENGNVLRVFMCHCGLRLSLSPSLAHTHTHTKNESRETSAEILAAFFHPLPVSPNMIWPYKDRLQWWETAAEECYRISLHGWSKGQARGSEQRGEGNELGGEKQVARETFSTTCACMRKGGWGVLRSRDEDRKMRECCRRILIAEG